MEGMSNNEFREFVKMEIKNSGLPAVQWLKKNGIAESNFYRWLREEKLPPYAKSFYVPGDLLRALGFERMMIVRKTKKKNPS